ncbi:MAG TPA: response regulator [Archangium sp.]|uniref:response regulator n=1 Tax=Archangium sp. TaxID=1872627 RepID=UPI002E2F8ADC|nr:response regulator [Archangium sp.]HEX5751317.1 response regulator [Archangium sp.]
MNPTPKKILLVDDSNTVLMMHRMLLHGQPYELLFARDGREAVEKAVANKPDLIFMDVMMPKLSGMDACRELRTHQETAGTPILLVTTRGEPHNVEAGYQAGCTEYITKPFDSAELLAKVRHYLGA